MAESIAEPEQTLRSHPPMFDQPHPYLLVTHGKRHHIQTFYNVPENRYFVRSIPELGAKYVCDCVGTGWMFVEDSASDDCCLYNIVTEQKVHLPTLRDASTYHGNCIVTRTPTDPDCRVIFYKENGSNEFVTCKVGDSSFVTEPLDPGSSGLCMASMINGKIYGMTCYKRELLVADDPEDPSCFWELGITPHPEQQRGNNGYLVDFAGQILLVQKVMREKEVASFNVFRADFAKMAWVKLGRVGDYAIFLEQRRGFACSTKGLTGAKPNCIYFIDGKRDRDVGVFDMEDQSLTITLPSSKVTARCSILRWILMPAASSPARPDSIKDRFTASLIALYKKMRDFDSDDMLKILSSLAVLLLIRRLFLFWIINCT